MESVMMLVNSLAACARESYNGHEPATKSTSGIRTYHMQHQDLGVKVKDDGRRQNTETDIEISLGGKVVVPGQLNRDTVIELDARLKELSAILPLGYIPILYYD